MTIKLDRRSLFRLAAAAPAAKVAAEPDDFFVYSTKTRNELGLGMGTRFTKVYRRDIERVEHDPGPWDDRTKMQVLQGGEWDIGEPELSVDFDERTGPDHWRTVLLTGHQARRFLEWWRG